jgi:isoleucyl-tRNA synthetase
MLKLSTLTLGVLAAALGCYGAFEQAMKTEGCISYLVLAAPVVAAAAAVVPYFAEAAWQRKHRLKAIVWTLVLIPCAATVFFAAAERVHNAKAGAEAERAAARAAAVRAEDALTDARAKASKAEADAKAMRKQKACKADCLARWDNEASAARTRVTEAEAHVAKLDAKAVTESPFKAPVWLLPASLDLLAFVAIWTGLALTKPVEVKKTTPRRRRRKAAPKKPAPKAPAQLAIVR